MIDARTRVIQVTFESEPDLAHPWKRQTRIVAVILYPLEVKRQLATIDNAKARAVELARQIIAWQLFRPRPLRPCSSRSR